MRLDRGGADPFLTDRGSVLSLSLSESGVCPPVNDDRPVLRPMGTLRALRSRTLVMGPATDWVRCGPAELTPGLALGLNAVILCDTPSAKMNCSRSSMFVRPLAAIQHKRAPSAKQVMCRDWKG